MARYSSNKNCRSKSHSSTVGNCMEIETQTIPKRELKLNVKLPEMSSTPQSSS